ncbi:MAG TPA: hypothetical protein VF384_02530 [Planctomycetota bacterium]
MTRFDPFAQPQGKPDSTKAAPPRYEEDILFATGEDVKQAPPADSSWDLLNEDVASLLPNGSSLPDVDLFGADILGEELPEQPPAPRRVEPPAPRPEAKATPPAQKQVGQPPRPVTPEQKQQGPAPRDAATPAATVRTLPPAEAAKVAEPRVKTTLPPPRLTIGPRPPRRGRHAPMIVLGVGVLGATWFGLVQHNYVLTAIVACLTLVGMVFARLSLHD